MRSDRGGEYTSHEFNTFCEKEGIQRELTAAYTPQQNGVSERKNRTLINVVLAMLSHAKLSKVFWGEALLTANYLQNRSPTKAIDEYKTPYELWFGRQPNLSYLRVFGCKAYVFVPKEKRQKLDSHSNECIFLGYSEESKAYRLMDSTNRKIIISRNVIFNENFDNVHKNLHEAEEIEEEENLLLDVDFFKSNPPNLAQPTQNAPPNQSIPLQQIQVVASPPTGQPLQNQHIPINSTNVGIQQQQQQQGSPLQNDLIESSTVSHNSENLYNEEVISHEINTPPSSSRPKRIIKPSRRLLESIQGRPQSNQPKKPYLKKHHQANVANISLQAPQTIKEPLERPDAQKWQDAINLELNSLKKNKTWKLTPLPSNRTPISSKWVFKIKTNADGTIDKYKARLVARGFPQVQGIDYTETFSPVVKLNSIKVLLALATQYNFEIHQLDVKTTFLNGNLDEEIYMSLPDGLPTPSNPQLVCKLAKSLYGLKQSSRAWYQRLDSYLLLQGYTRLESDADIYIKRENDQGFIILIVYVDDCIVVSNKAALI